MREERLRQLYEIYRRHGWTLRRILFRSGGAESTAIPKGIEVFESDMDAAWFSRSSMEGKTTWELRSLETEQYALCASIADDSDESDAEGTLFELEEKMRDRLRK